MPQYAPTSPSAPTFQDSSKEAKSKLKEEIFKSTSSLFIPKLVDIHRENLATPFFAIGTPFGLPVLPEVNKTYVILFDGSIVFSSLFY